MKNKRFGSGSSNATFAAPRAAACGLPLAEHTQEKGPYTQLKRTCWLKPVLANLLMCKLSAKFLLLLLLTGAWAQQCPTGHRCHSEATCSVSQTASLGYTCLCGTGYLGNGFECFTVSSVANGGFHTCAIISDGSVKVRASVFREIQCGSDSSVCVSVLG